MQVALLARPRHAGNLLFAAVAHPSEAVRVDCLDLVASSPKGTEPPGNLELMVSTEACAQMGMCCLLVQVCAGCGHGQGKAAELLHSTYKSPPALVPTFLAFRRSLLNS
eukprot:973050-Pelagomonas_calceolata.AAC.1